MFQEGLYTILIIEDNNDIRENLDELLLLEGYNTLQAGSGNKGIALCIEYNPDLIICDISMPDGNGYDVLNAVVSTSKSHEIPFIFSTSKSEKRELRKSLLLGADKILVKPYDMDLLVKTVSDLIKSGSKRHLV